MIGKRHSATLAMTVAAIVLSASAPSVLADQGDVAPAGAEIVGTGLLEITPQAGLASDMETRMLNWIIRGLLIIAGIVASWFVTRDSPQFGLMQMAAVLLLIVLIVAILAFWPERFARILNRVKQP